MLPPSAKIDKFIEKMPSEELFDLAESVEDVQSHPAWGRLMGIVERGVDSQRKVLEVGPIREQVEYANWMGFFRGTTVVSDIARQILEGASERRLRLEREAAESERAESPA